MANRDFFRRLGVADEVAAPTGAPAAADPVTRGLPSGPLPTDTTPDTPPAVPITTAVSPAATLTTEAKQPQPSKQASQAKQPKTLRRVLLALGPVAVLAGGLYAYTAGGRYVSTDNAYVHAGKVTVATD